MSRGGRARQRIDPGSAYYPVAARLETDGEPALEVWIVLDQEDRLALIVRRQPGRRRQQLPPRLAHWQRHRHLGAETRSRLELERAAQRDGTLAHAGDAVRRARQVEAAAVVGHFEAQLAPGAAQRDHDAVGAGVAGDVVQRLLEDAEGRDLDRRQQSLALAVEIELDRDAGLLLERFGLPLDRRRQPEVVEQTGTQLRGDPAHAGDHLVEQRLHRHGATRQARAGALQLALERHQVELERRELVTQLVLDLARDRSPLVLARLLEMTGESAHLAERFFELHFVHVAHSSVTGTLARVGFHVHRRSAFRAVGEIAGRAVGNREARRRHSSYNVLGRASWHMLCSTKGE